jgi:hypothetical protein
MQKLLLSHHYSRTTHCYWSIRPSGFMSLEQFIEFFEDSAILHVSDSLF